MFIAKVYNALVFMDLISDLGANPGAWSPRFRVEKQPRREMKRRRTGGDDGISLRQRCTTGKVKEKPPLTLQAETMNFYRIFASPTQGGVS